MVEGRLEVRLVGRNNEAMAPPLVVWCPGRCAVWWHVHRSCEGL